MPAGGRRNRAARRDDALDALLTAATALLRQEDSFGELSVERLATKAGISRASFYIFFEDKGELVRAWFDRVDAEAAEAVTAWWALEGDVGLADVCAALERLVAVYRDQETLMAAIGEMTSYDPLLRERSDAA